MVGVGHSTDNRQGTQVYLILSIYQNNTFIKLNNCDDYIAISCTIITHEGMLVLSRVVLLEHKYPSPLFFVFMLILS